MKRIGLALVLSLVIGLTLLPGSAWGRQHHGVFVGCCVFIGPLSPHFIHHGFIQEGFFAAPFGSTVIAVNPAPQPVWVPGSWWWNGFQWVWQPGYWFFPGQ